jgi:Brp/Blh family beta-carotene 15,15'-monooxygenase
MAVERPGRGLSLSSGIRRTLRRPVGPATWLPHLALTVTFAAGLSVPRSWRYAPLVASVVVLGLPHGAADVVALPRALAGRITARGVGVVGLIYLVFGVAYAATWFLFPVAAAVGFVLLTWFHWGQGELHPLVVVFGADYLDARPLRALTLVVRGGLPMLVPLLAFPDRYRTVVAAFVTPFGGDVAAWPFGPTVRLALGAAFGAITLLALAWGYRRADDRAAWAVDAGETGLLWAFFATVPPVLAVGVYFCLWHSVRHVARVLPLDGQTAATLAAGRLRPGLARFAAETALPTAGALAIAGAMWLLAPSPDPTLRGVVALYLVVVAVLTLPHVVIVTWLDRIQGVW